MTTSGNIVSYKDFVPYVLGIFASVLVYMTGISWGDAVKRAIIHSKSERIRMQGPWIFAGIITAILIIFSVIIAVIIWVNNTFLPDPINGNCINVCTSSNI